MVPAGSVIAKWEYLDRMDVYEFNFHDRVTTDRGETSLEVLHGTTTLVDQEGIPGELQKMIVNCYGVMDEDHLA